MLSHSHSLREATFFWRTFETEEWPPFLIEVVNVPDWAIPRNFTRRYVGQSARSVQRANKAGSQIVALLARFSETNK